MEYSIWNLFDVIWKHFSFQPPPFPSFTLLKVKAGGDDYLNIEILELFLFRHMKNILL